MNESTTATTPQASTTTATKTDTLPATAVAALAEMRKTLASPGTKLGLLARRVEAAVRDLHEAATEYGTSVVVRSALGRELRIPMATEVLVRLTVSAAGEAPAVHQFVVGGVASGERVETPLEKFPVATVVAQNAPVATGGISTVNAAAGSASNETRLPPTPSTPNGIGRTIVI